MKEVHVLLAEDNRGDVLLVREALAAHDIPYDLHVATNGEEAVEYMAHMGDAGKNPCPDILILDLNLPRIDGHEVLREFRRHPACTTTPVIVISSSDSPLDREKASAWGVTRYFRKPTKFELFLELGAMVKEAVEGN